MCHVAMRAQPKRSATIEIGEEIRFRVVRGCEPQVLSAQSLNGEILSEGRTGWNRILPVWVQARTEIFTRTSKEGMQPASGRNNRRRRGQVEIVREVHISARLVGHAPLQAEALGV